MAVSIFSMDFLLFLIRWLHYFFGVIWIGHLYYFNYTQGAVMPKLDATQKTGILTKLLPEALWWFRWGAMGTMITGVIYLILKAVTGSGVNLEAYASSWGVAILVGSLLGLTMWANVWFIIWPAQKVVMKSAELVAGGGQPLPEAAGCAAKALLASRTNALFSIPMLFFMGAASHLSLNVTPDTNYLPVTLVVGVIWAAIEINAIKGKLGPMQTVRRVIGLGFALTALFVAARSFTL